MIINFPEIVENTIAIAQSPAGDIYFGGYNIYKLISIDTEDKEQNMYLIDLTAHSAKIEDVRFNSTTSTLAISVQTDDNSLSSAPTIKVNIPKSLQSGSLEVSSTGNGSIENNTLIKHFTISQQRLTSHTSDVTLQILLNNGLRGTILIKATESNLSPEEKFPEEYS